MKVTERENPASFTFLHKAASSSEETPLFIFSRTLSSPLSSPIYSRDIPLSLIFLSSSFVFNSIDLGVA